MPIDEAVRIDPASPYGESKFMIERALHWANEIHGLRSACLRYFKTRPEPTQDGRLGEDHDPETHLIPLRHRCGAGPPAAARDLRRGL